MEIKSGPAPTPRGVRGPALVAVRSSDCLQAIRIASDEQQVGNQAIVDAQWQTTLAGDRHRFIMGWVGPMRTVMMTPMHRSRRCRGSMPATTSLGGYALPRIHSSHGSANPHRNTAPLG